MNRRNFVGLSLAAAGAVFAPKFGRWHRQGSGLFVPTGPVEFTVNGKVYEVQPYTDGIDNHFVMPVPVGDVRVFRNRRPVGLRGYPHGLTLSMNDTLTVDWSVGWPA